MNNRTARALAGLLLGLALVCANAFAQAPPPAPGTTQLDTNGDGTQDVAIRRLDTDGVAGTTERVHIDGNRNGVIDPGERVFDGVVGYLIVDNVLTIVEDTGTERVKTVLVPFDKNGDGDCDDDGEVIQRNNMPDSAASVQIRFFPTGPVLNAQLTGATTFEADLNAIAPAGGVDAIPIEIVALSLTGGPQPITVTLQPLQPSPGMLVENVNVVNNNLDGRLLAQTGTVDSFFDVWVEVEIAGARLISLAPIRLQSNAGIYPPAPLQSYVLVNPGVVLVDAATGQPAGVLERFDFTPHVAPRLDCACDKLSITPIITTHEEKNKEIVDSPEARGAVNAGDPKVYDVEIELVWRVTIACKGPGDKCEGRYIPSAKSEGWRIDGKPSAPVGLDSHENVRARSDVVCTGRCEGTGLVSPHPKTIYKVSVKKGAGGVITGKLSGVITLTMNPADCPGDAWTMVLVYEGDVKTGEVSIDPKLSNWDGDKKPNVADKNPLDPTKP